MLFKLTVTLVALAAFASAATVKRVACPDSKHTAVNAACCVFYSLRDDIQANLFDYECAEDTHEVLRLTFHDAIGFSQSGQLQGSGADGSMIIFSDTELTYAANVGIEDSVDSLKPFLQKYLVSAGDLIQFAGAVGVSNCQGAPRLQFLAGRPNATAPASDGTIPGPQQSVDDLLARMADAGFTAAELIHLLAAHTVARADDIDPTKSALPLDTTPFTFDTQFFLEVLLKGDGFPGSANNFGEVESPLAAEGELRLQSDFALARDSRTACEWQSMVNKQQLMMNNFRTAMAKLAVTGQNISQLHDCTEAVPFPREPVVKPATYPAGKSSADLQQACASPFPTLATDPGQPTQIPA